MSSTFWVCQKIEIKTDPETCDTRNETIRETFQVRIANEKFVPISEEINEQLQDILKN